MSELKLAEERFICALVIIITVTIIIIHHQHYLFPLAPQAVTN